MEVISKRTDTIPRTVMAAVWPDEGDDDTDSAHIGSAGPDEGDGDTDGTHVGSAVWPGEGDGDMDGAHVGSAVWPGEGDGDTDGAHTLTVPVLISNSVTVFTDGLTVGQQG